MAYLLKNRALPANFDDESYAPCIFCGEMITHFNGGGRGLVVNSCEEGEAHAYLYCHEYKCQQRVSDELYEHSMWFCGCEADYIDVIGKTCPSCGASSRKPTPINGEEQKREYVYTYEMRVPDKLRHGIEASVIGQGIEKVCPGKIVLVSATPCIAYKQE